jgi:hypothetical protein
MLLMFQSPREYYEDPISAGPPSFTNLDFCLVSRGQARGGQCCFQSTPFERQQNIKHQQYTTRPGRKIVASKTIMPNHPHIAPCAQTQLSKSPCLLLPSPRLKPPTRSNLKIKHAVQHSHSTPPHHLLNDVIQLPVRRANGFTCCVDLW